MRKSLQTIQTGAMSMALALGGNAMAHPDMASACNRQLCTEETAEKDVAYTEIFPPDSFRLTEAVAPGRLDKAVSKLGAASEERAISVEDATNHFESSRPAFHAPTPDSASPIPTAFSAPHVVLDGTIALTGGWQSSGQYVLTFVLNARN